MPARREAFPDTPTKGSPITSPDFSLCGICHYPMLSCLCIHSFITCPALQRTEAFRELENFCLNPLCREQCLIPGPELHGVDRVQVRKHIGELTLRGGDDQLLTGVSDMRIRQCWEEGGWGIGKVHSSGRKPSQPSYTSLEDTFYGNNSCPLSVTERTAPLRAQA